MSIEILYDCTTGTKSSPENGVYVFFRQQNQQKVGVTKLDGKTIHFNIEAGQNSDEDR